MISRFPRVVEFTLKHEGEHSDRASDAGGDTWYGIARTFHPDVKPWPPTRAQATEILRQRYWMRVRGDEVPVMLAPLLFECAVNQGPETAVRLLQEELNMYRLPDTRLKVDGVFGALTLAATWQERMEIFATRYAARRAWRYEINPQEREYGLGWYRRLMECMVFAYELAR